MILHYSHYLLGLNTNLIVELDPALSMTIHCLAFSHELPQVGWLAIVVFFEPLRRTCEQGEQETESHELRIFDASTQKELIRCYIARRVTCSMTAQYSMNYGEYPIAYRVHLDRASIPA